MTAKLTIQLLAFFVASATAIWPLPRGLTSGSTTLKLSPGFSIDVSIKNAPSDLQQAVSRTTGFLHNDKLERLVVGRGSGDSTGGARSLSKLTLSLAKGAAINSVSVEAVKPLETRDEAYELEVPSDGSGATLTANSTLGLFRGLTTFSQMWYTFDGTIYTVNAPFSIKDSPAYVCNQLTCNRELVN